MGRAFEATDGELAEKLFAALKAGDDAGGDSRGKQSASMLVVRKGGGRNINNDRYIYINVDDNPQPIPELRRLLDLNLGLLYPEKVGRLRAAGKPKEAREAAAQGRPLYADGELIFHAGGDGLRLGDKDGGAGRLPKSHRTGPAAIAAAISGRADAPARAVADGKDACEPIFEDQEFLAPDAVPSPRSIRHPLRFFRKT